MTLIAVMAGLVGAGAAPPPLGLLQPVWEVEPVRKAVLGDARVVGLLLSAVVVLLLMAGTARAFTFAFLAGLTTGEPRAGRFRQYLRAGARHFIWSSLLSVPLYLVLFGAEWRITGGAMRRLEALIVSSADLTPATLLLELAGPALQFLLVLVPWTLLTLPLMVLMYELTPAAMLAERSGPERACGRVLRVARGQAGAFVGYLGARLLLQVAGNAAALLVLLPCVVLAALPSAPMLLAGSVLSGALGGPSTPGGVFVSSIAVLLSLAVLYCVLCAALLPVSVLINSYSLHFLAARDPRLDAFSDAA